MKVTYACVPLFALLLASLSVAQTFPNMTATTIGQSLNLTGATLLQFNFTPSASTIGVIITVTSLSPTNQSRYAWVTAYGQPITTFTTYSQACQLRNVQNFTCTLRMCINQVAATTRNQETFYVLIFSSNLAAGVNDEYSIESQTFDAPNATVLPDGQSSTFDLRPGEDMFFEATRDLSTSSNGSFIKISLTTNVTTTTSYMTMRFTTTKNAWCGGSYSSQSYGNNAYPYTEQTIYKCSNSRNETYYARITHIGANNTVQGTFRVNTRSIKVGSAYAVDSPPSSWSCARGDLCALRVTFPTSAEAAGYLWNISAASALNTSLLSGSYYSYIYASDTETGGWCQAFGNTFAYLQRYGPPTAEALLEPCGSSEKYLYFISENDLNLTITSRPRVLNYRTLQPGVQMNFTNSDPVVLTYTNTFVPKYGPKYFQLKSAYAIEASGGSDSVNVIVNRAATFSCATNTQEFSNNGGYLSLSRLPLCFFENLGTNFFFDVQPGNSMTFPYGITLSLEDFTPMTKTQVVAGTYFDTNVYTYYQLEPKPDVFSETTDSYEVLVYKAHSSYCRLYTMDTSQQGCADNSWSSELPNDPEYCQVTVMVSPLDGVAYDGFYIRQNDNTTYNVTRQSRPFDFFSSNPTTVTAPNKMYAYRLTGTSEMNITVVAKTGYVYFQGSYGCNSFSIYCNAPSTCSQTFSGSGLIVFTSGNIGSGNISAEVTVTDKQLQYGNCHDVSRELDNCAGFLRTGAAMALNISIAENFADQFAGGLDRGDNCTYRRMIHFVCRSLLKECDLDTGLLYHDDDCEAECKSIASDCEAEGCGFGDVVNCNLMCSNDPNDNIPPPGPVRPTGPTGSSSRLTLSVLGCIFAIFRFFPVF